ncbi:MAG: class II fructose-bisphosphate aldolase, partial [Flavobacteriaceae bacterium]|nr:class II fructose-bisphosphate aldolase [Flavobacteriaceae bacterium]
MSQKIKSGVATGNTVQEIFKLAKEKNFALPAANIIGSSSANAVLETAKELNAPVII